MTATAAGVLDYHAPKARRFLSLNKLVMFTAAILLPMYYAALVPSISQLSMSELSMSWDEGQSWLRGGSAIFRVHPGKVLDDRRARRQTGFITFGAAVTVIWILIRRPWVRLLLATLAVAVPPVFTALSTDDWYKIPLYGPMVFVQSLLGSCDGETWSEGIVAIAVMGVWMIIWLVFWLLSLGVFILRPQQE